MKFVPTKRVANSRDLVAEEGLISSLSYFISSESRIISKINHLKQVVSNVSEETLANIQLGIRTVSCANMLILVSFINKVLSSSGNVIASAERFAKAKEEYEHGDKDLDEDYGDVEGAEQELLLAISDAGYKIGWDRHAIQAIQTKIGGKTIGELGYTKSDVLKIISEVTKDGNACRKAYNTLVKIDKDINLNRMLKVDYDDDYEDDTDQKEKEGFMLYAKAIGILDKAFPIVDYFLFCLDRKLK